MKNFFLIIILIITASCQSVKDGLTMQKKNNSDEFLIKKKNPLILPPEYGKLPTPVDNEIKEKKENINEIELLLKSGVENKSNRSNKKSPAEEIILKEIKTE